MCPHHHHHQRRTYTHRHDTDDEVLMAGCGPSTYFKNTPNQKPPLLLILILLLVFNLFRQFLSFFSVFVDSGLRVSFRQIHPTPRIRTAISLSLSPPFTWSLSLSHLLLFVPLLVALFY